MATSYKFEFCKDCPLYECELVEEYVQFRESHAQIKKLPYANAEVFEASDYNNDDNNRVVHGIVTSATDAGIKDTTKCFSHNEVNTDNILSYNQLEQKDYYCTMGRYSVDPVECGTKNVTEGIGDDYKVEFEDIDYNGKVKGKLRDDLDARWRPGKAVFISAQTGKGKNYFIENTLLPYIRKLNYVNETKYKVLILSNRLALKQQIINRLNGYDDLYDDEENGKPYYYRDVADVMTYQSLLYSECELKRKQKGEYPKYLYVICDEAHFFTSDAMFNPYTEKILRKIVDIFSNVIRVYMSATPYECLKYINEYDSRVVFYHFKRDYSYLDIKTYSEMDELYEIIAESIGHKEKWLIFIDDKNKCQTVKKQLEKAIQDKENEKLKDENTLDRGNDKSKEKAERVYVINAESKNDSVFQWIVKNERLNKDTYVLISTSVLDNGVNLTGIKNIVVSDMEKAKCMQMVGRARVEGNEHKTLYMKRFHDGEVENRINNLEKRKNGYHKYELAYDKNGKISNNSEELKFFLKYYNGKQTDWENAKHWFGRCNDGGLYYNEIAKSMMEVLIPQYQFIRREMSDEGTKDGNKCIIQMGQKYLEYQLSWFGKKYCEDDDITFVNREKAKNELIAFLETYAEKGMGFASEKEMKGFTKKFIELFDAAFGKSDKNSRQYGVQKMNSLLEEQNIGYEIDGKPQVGPWKVIRKDR